MAVYFTSYLEGDVIDTLRMLPLGSCGTAFDMCSSFAETASGRENGVLNESVTSIVMWVGWLTVADVRPGPWTWHL